MQRRWILATLLSSFLLNSLPLQSQTIAATTNAKVALTQALARLSGGQAFTDVVINTTAKRVTGPTTEGVNVVLKGRGAAFGKVDYGVSSPEVRTETYASSAGIPACEWIDVSGAAHLSPAQNCVVAIWWLPQLSPLAWIADPDVIATYLGHENYLGSAVEHYTITKRFSSQSATSSAAATRIALLATIDAYFDSGSGLPTVLAYPIHPDSDLATDLRIEVRFSNYTSIGGVLVPYRITRLVNGGVTLDITVTSVMFNAGLSDNEFELH